MNYTLYQLEFQNGVRFGSGNLDSTEITFHADTFFSALFQEALKFGKEKEFLLRIEKESFCFLMHFLTWENAFIFQNLSYI